MLLLWLFPEWEDIFFHDQALVLELKLYAPEKTVLAMAADEFCTIALVFKLPFTYTVCPPPAHITVKEHVAALDQWVRQVADHYGLKLDATVKLCIGLLHKGGKALRRIKLLQATQRKQAIS